MLILETDIYCIPGSAGSAFPWTRLFIPLKRNRKIKTLFTNNIASTVELLITFKTYFNITERAKLNPPVSIP